MNHAPQNGSTTPKKEMVNAGMQADASKSTILLRDHSGSNMGYHHGAKTGYKFMLSSIDLKGERKTSGGPLYEMKRPVKFKLPGPQVV
jgi:hypothetical protein